MKNHDIQNHLLICYSYKKIFFWKIGLELPLKIDFEFTLILKIPNFWWFDIKLCYKKSKKSFYWDVLINWIQLWTINICVRIYIFEQIKNFGLYCAQVLACASFIKWGIAQSIRHVLDHTYSLHSFSRKNNPKFYTSWQAIYKGQINS